MAPVSTGLGEVYQYYVEGPNAAETDPKIIETELMDQRTLQDWVLRPLLKSVPGVIDVNGMGGFVKQYQVLVDPAKLRKFDLTLHDIYSAVAKNNANAGGNVLERHAERAIVRSLGLIKTMSDIESIIVKGPAAPRSSFVMSRKSASATPSALGQWCSTASGRSWLAPCS